MKFAAPVDWMMELVDWIELVDGVGLAVASGSRLATRNSRLDHAAQHARTAAQAMRGKAARSAQAMRDEQCTSRQSSRLDQKVVDWFLAEASTHKP